MTLVDVLARSAAPAIPPGAGSDRGSGSTARAFADVLEDALGATTGGTETLTPTDGEGEPTSAAAPQSADPTLVVGAEDAVFPVLPTVDPAVTGTPVVPPSSDESGIADRAATEASPSAATAPSPLTATTALALVPADTGASSATAVVGQAVSPLPVAEAASASGVNGPRHATAAPGATASSSRTASAAPAVTAAPSARIPTGFAGPGESAPASDAMSSSSPALADATTADSAPERSAPASLPGAGTVEPRPSATSHPATTTPAFAPIPAAAPAAPAAATVSSPTPAQASPPPLPPQLSGPVLSLARAGEGDHRLTLTVSPEDLGPVTVRAHITGGAIHIELHAPSDAGREALRAVLADLRRDLAAAAPHASLALATNDAGTGPGSGPGSGSASGSSQGGGGASAGAQRGTGRGDEPAPSTPVPTPAPRPTPPAGAIDVYA